MEKVIFDRIRKAMAGALMLTTLAGCTPESSGETRVLGAVLPHHLLVEDTMDDFYAEIAKNLKNDPVERIILLSPNHFNYGYHNIQSTTLALSDSVVLEVDTIEALAASSPLAIEPIDFDLEHGVTSHLAFLERYFPSAELIPITFKYRTPPHEMDLLLDALLETGLDSTLVLASIDFSHYVSETVALQNDERIQTWLELFPDADYSHDTVMEMSESLGDPEGTVAMDSPESMYMLIRLMRAGEANSFSLWGRTSSASLTGNTDPSQNTSHLYGWFVP